MGRADLHIHSIYSHDGTSTIPAILKHASEKSNLDVIAITDHDSMAGVAEAQALAPLYGIEVIPGMEISTSQGHLVALFIQHPIPANLSLLQTISRVREQGGICIAPHPEARGTSSLKVNDILWVLKQPWVAHILLGVEIFNGGLVYTRNWQRTASKILSLPLTYVGSSDAHLLSMIGKGVTLFPGRTAADMRKALVTRQTQVPAGKGLGGMHALVSYVPRYLLRKMGWAVWNEHPEKPLRLKRLPRNLKFGEQINSSAIS
jgi:hypothetical protein